MRRNSRYTLVHGGTNVTREMFGFNGWIARLAGSVSTFFAVCLTSMILPANDAAASDAVLIDFSSTHCGPCRAMAPVLAQLERSGVPVRHVDVNREPAMANRYGIRQTPTFVVVSAGKEVTRLVGMQNIEKLRSALSINRAGPLISTGSDLGQNRTGAPQTRLAPAHASSVAQTLTAAPRPSRSEAMPSLSMASGIERAEAATVRLRVHDGNGFGAGTGTIIDTNGEYALVLTCGHLFRENQGKGKVEADLFIHGQTKTVLGEVLDFDADDRDIALVQIKPGFQVQPVPLLSKGQAPQKGQRVFSSGCDRGDDPSRRDTRITGVNKYVHNTSNIEIQGAHIDGRSGGGLFDEQGRLLGVCNAADYKGDVGIYTGPGTVQWQLDRLKLSDLYQPRRVFANNDSNVHGLGAGTASNGQTPSPERLASLHGPVPGTVALASATTPIQQPTTNRQPPASQEVIVIVRDPGNPNGASRVMTLRQPTSELMRMIEQQAR